MANLNGLAGTILGQTVTRLLGELQIVADQFDQHRTVLEMLKRKEMLEELIIYSLFQYMLIILRTIKRFKMSY